MPSSNPNPCDKTPQQIYPAIFQQSDDSQTLKTIFPQADLCGVQLFKARSTNTIIIIGSFKPKAVGTGGSVSISAHEE